MGIFNKNSKIGIIYNIKKSIISFCEASHLAIAHKDSYLKLFRERTLIRNSFRKHGFYCLHPVRMDIWKLYYGTAYFKAKFFDQSVKKWRPVFIKMQGPLLTDCYQNELIVNSYLNDVSPFLASHTIKILDTFILNSNSFIIYEYCHLKDVSSLDSINGEVRRFLEEYDRTGIIHTDLGLSNMGWCNGDFFVFDYGTALCPRSNHIRVRMTGDAYNHLEKIVPDAKKRFLNPCFYYDDGIHLTGTNHSSNYIVSDRKSVIARLGNQYYQYCCQRQRSILLISREDI